MDRHIDGRMTGLKVILGQLSQSQLTNNKLLWETEHEQEKNYT